MVYWNIIGITLTHSNDLLCRHFREMAFFWYNRLFCSSFMFLERKRTLRFGQRNKLEELWKHQSMSTIFVLFYAHLSNVAGMRGFNEFRIVLFHFIFSFRHITWCPRHHNSSPALSLSFSQLNLSTLFSHSSVFVFLMNCWNGFNSNAFILASTKKKLRHKLISWCYANKTYVVRFW